MKPLTEKILKSGLVDKHMAEMLEKWGRLPAGSSELVKDDALKNATKGQLDALAEDIGKEVEKIRALKETSLDLDRLRWPVRIDQLVTNTGKAVALHLDAVIDRMGRLYFRIQDVHAEWFVPGYFIERTKLDKSVDGTDGRKLLLREQILESTVLFSGDSPVCVQVTVHTVA